MRDALLATAATLTACLTGPAHEPTRVEQATESPPESKPDPVERPYKLRMGATIVWGRLDPVIIQRTVRRDFHGFRLCLDAGFARNSQLTGRLDVRFVIGRDGLVTDAQSVVRADTVPDRQVVQCVVERFRGLVFPEPDSGVVTVQYPLFVAPHPAPAPTPASH